MADIPDNLTEREREILTCLVDGLSNHEIAARLHLAYRTVRWYNSQIYNKLGVENREKAVEQARTLGLLESAVIDGKHNLPALVTPFVGRRNELDELAVLLSDSDTRLVTILAPGGMGKTRLAMEAARTQIGRYEDGVFFIPLAHLSSPDDIMTTIAENVDFSFFGSEPPKQQLLNYFRERPILLILDNFEHLLDGVQLIADILQTAPKVKALVTSREKLNLSSETIFLLSGMPHPTWETPEDALEYDAVKLFMQSARRVQPDFELQAHNLDFLARICRLTAGMPLALVLAASWVDMLTLEQIAAEIQQSLDILETDTRDVPERQRSVRASFNYSWVRLNAAEQDSFMKLSVFRGGFTAEAAHMVAGANLRELRKLVDKALVQTQPLGRYEVHELLRQYGEEKLLQADAAEAVQQAHSTYYMAFMAERDEDIKGRRQQAGLHEIRADFENIRQAWLWAADHRLYESFNHVLDCLVNYAEMDFSTLDAQAILQQTVTALLPAAGETPHPVWEQAVVRRERINYVLNAPIDHASVEVILKGARERGDKFEIAYCLWVLGDYANMVNDYETYRACYEECLSLRESVGDAYYIAHTFVGIAHVYIGQNEIETAMRCLRQSAQIRRVNGDRRNLCFSLTLLGSDLAMFGGFEEAEALLDEALMIQAEIGKAPVYVGALAFKAMLAFWRGEFAMAVQLLQAGQDFAKQRDYIGFKQGNLALLSWTASMEGDYQRGFTLCQEVRSIGGFSESHLMLWQMSWGFALAQCGLENYEAARQAFYDCLHRATISFKAPTLQYLCLPVAAVLAAQSRNPERAVELLGLAHTPPQELTGWMGRWPLLTDLQHNLETELGATAFAAAWTSGAKLDLGAVVKELRTEFIDTEAK